MMNIIGKKVLNNLNVCSVMFQTEMKYYRNGQNSQISLGCLKLHHWLNRKLFRGWFCNLCERKLDF